MPEAKVFKAFIRNEQITYKWREKNITTVFDKIEENNVKQCLYSFGRTRFLIQDWAKLLTSCKKGKNKQTNMAIKILKI